MRKAEGCLPYGGSQSAVRSVRNERSNEASCGKDKKNAAFSTGAYKPYVTEKKRKPDVVFRRIFLVWKRRRYEQFQAQEHFRREFTKRKRARKAHPSFTAPSNEASCEKDKKNAAFSTGAYKPYVTEKKRKFDAVFRRIFFV